MQANTAMKFTEYVI